MHTDTTTTTTTDNPAPQARVPFRDHSAGYVLVTAEEARAQAELDTARDTLAALVKRIEDHTLIQTR